VDSRANGHRRTASDVGRFDLFVGTLKQTHEEPTVDTFAAVATFFPMFRSFWRPTTADKLRLFRDDKQPFYDHQGGPALPAILADEPGLARQQRQTLGLAHSLFGSPLRG
jgi:hypothetical protein